jgi:ubiquinone/menaquinone biosynthesis C-methylase UbiE/DNA-binding transcriptional ArsR family regulator
MQDPAYLKYVEYFKKQPMTQQYYYYVGIEKTVTAKELSKKMGRSIQTVTNALRDLERTGLLKSEKKGRVRTYTLKDPRLFKGLSSHRYFPGRRIKEDIISRSIFSQNMEKWLRYLADIMDGTLYVNQTFYTNVISSLKVDFVIENVTGQNLVTFINIRNSTDVEAALGRIFSLILSKELNPNLRIITAVCLINQDHPALTGEERGVETDFLNFLRSTFSRLENSARDFKVLITYMIETVQPGDVEKPDFAEKLSAAITERMPYYSGEALPGEVRALWEIDKISERRRRAFEAIQNKIKPKHRYTFPNFREILPGNAELKRVLYPQSLLLSLGLKEGDVFVDVSCFEGLFTIPAARIVGEKGRVHGIEFSPLALEKLKESLSENNLNNVVLYNDFPERVKLDKKIADIVFFGTALYDMYNPMKSLKNAYDMLKDAGKLVILEWKSRDPNEKPTRDPVDDVGIGPSMRARLDKELITEFVKESGFKIETIREEGVYLYSIIAGKSDVQVIPKPI